MKSGNFTLDVLVNGQNAEANGIVELAPGEPFTVVFANSGDPGQVSLEVDGILVGSFPMYSESAEMQGPVPSARIFVFHSSDLPNAYIVGAEHVALSVRGLIRAIFVLHDGLLTPEVLSLWLMASEPSDEVLGGTI